MLSMLDRLITNSVQLLMTNSLSFSFRTCLPLDKKFSFLDTGSMIFYIKSLLKTRLFTVLKGAGIITTSLSSITSLLASLFAGLAF